MSEQTKVEEGDEIDPPVTIWSKSTTICIRMNDTYPREEKMPRTKSEAERTRSQQAALASQYRAIGPAAIVAALLHTKKRKPNKAG